MGTKESSATGDIRSKYWREHCTYLEVAYLLLYGELPTEIQLKEWVHDITYHTMLHETTKKFMEGFRYDAHPMVMLVSTVAALSDLYPESKNIHDPESRLLQIKRLIGKMPSIAAMSYRHSVGFPYVYPDNELSYPENFMNMLWKMVEPKYAANAMIARALDILFISACGPRAELQHEHHAGCWQLASRSVPFHRFRGIRSLGAASWGRERGSFAYARRDRLQGQHPRLH